MKGDLEQNMSLNNFISKWSNDYTSELKLLPLFNTNITSKWNLVTRQKFIKIFYHARGHFYDFLWYMGNYAADKMVKKVILSNIEEEFGYASKSHEELYMDFAQCHGVDLSTEHIEEKYYVNSIKNFNKNHLRWLANHDADSRLCAFAAYEKLDNVDYPYLTKVADSISTDRKGMLFFKVHERVEHFETTEEFLHDIWQHDNKKVEEAFGFIALNQIEMWRNLYNAVVE